MRGSNIRLIKGHCVYFDKGDIQKQYKRNGDLVYYENYTKKGTSTTSADFEEEHGAWEYSENTGLLQYITINGENYDSGALDLYTLIHIDTDNEGYLFALVPYNIQDEITFEIDNRGIFTIIEN